MRGMSDSSFLIARSSKGAQMRNPHPDFPARAVLPRLFNDDSSIANKQLAKCVHKKKRMGKGEDPLTDGCKNRGQ
jgi:hypothetical protein